ncbi:P-loop containing nucleoside triphosphate hydrolase protein [Entophlyctis helioformis]|nr:P-loop containing nucleoside triphosphate hydrolase protein [Entophlyctis helioformis]
MLVRRFQIRRAGQSLTVLLPSALGKIVRGAQAHAATARRLKENANGDVKPLGDVYNSAVSARTTVASAAPNNRSASILVDAFRRALNGRTLHMNFRFENLGLKLNTGKVVLHGVTGEIRSSRMTAIMGPSGAGKTTFMNVLCGKVSRTSGKLFVSGKEAEMTTFKKIIGYVPQEDIMHRELTVREVILHAARIRLPASWTSGEVEQYADNVISALNLSHVAHSPIGDETTRGVSGGQRKRANIGMELAAVPVCLFLDEPTSGLDSTAALQVADILEQITELGLTIVAVIHQPRVEIFRKFDDVLMIAPGGRTAYLGPTHYAQTYFEKLGYLFDAGANAADVLMDILSGKGVNPTNHYTPDDLVQLWIDRDKAGNAVDTGSVASGSSKQAQPVDTEEDNTVFHETVRDIVRERGAPVLRQIWYCHNRSLIQQMRQITSLVLEVIVGMLAGLLMGVAVQGTPEMFIGLLVVPLTPLSVSPLQWLVPQYGLLIGMAVALAGAPAGVKVFGEEKPVYWRETASGHSPFAYYTGKTIATCYRILLSSLHFTALLHVIATPIVNFQSQYLMIMLTFYGVYGMSAVVSMVVAKENSALLSVVVCLFAAVLCGYGPNLNQAETWGISWLFALSFNRWAAEVQFSESVMPYSNVYILDPLINGFGYTINRLSTDFGAIVLIGIAWRIAAFFLLIGLNRSKQR